jgi:hypothetical protein
VPEESQPKVKGGSTEVTVGRTSKRSRISLYFPLSEQNSNIRFLSQPKHLKVTILIKQIKNQKACIYYI